ncbi:membrane protein, partial [Streptomyces scabiei]
MSKTTVKDVSTAEREHTAVPRTVGGSRAFAILLLITGAAG